MAKDRSVKDPCQAAGRCVYVILHDHGAVCGLPCRCARCVMPRSACQDLTGACGHRTCGIETRARRRMGR